MAANSGSELITETDVRNYFIQHGGIVKNNDIVTHFRSHLANPMYKDEARALFKSIVNKLATVKVEKGEKFLVLKRQFFPSDGNGNPVGLGSQHQQQLQQASIAYGNSPSTRTANPILNTRSPQRTGEYQQPRDYEYDQNFQNYPLQQQSAPITSSNPYNFNPYNHQVPPPYIPQSNANYMPPQQQQQGQYQYYQQQGPQHQSPSQLSKSQPSLHGSNFSLTSNSAAQAYAAAACNAYLNSPQHSSSAVLHNSNENYPCDFGLPTSPPPSMKATPPRRLSFTSPSASGLQGMQQNPAFDRHGVSSGRTPPPYRPPPPLGLGGSNTPPSLGLPTGMHGTRMMSPPSAALGQQYRSPPPINFAYSPSRGYDPGSQGQMGTGHGNLNLGQLHQYQRSISGPGNVTSPTTTTGSKSNALVSHSSSPASVAFLQAATTTASTPVTGVQFQAQAGLPAEGVPAPPVPPRFKRGSSSSNSPNSEANINRSIANAMSSDQEAMSSRGSVESGIDRETDSSGNDKENANPFGGQPSRSRSSSLPNGSDADGSIASSNPSGNGNGNGISDDASEESEQKISVKERMQKFNRIASESELGKLKNSNNVNKGNGNQYVSELDDDTASLSSYGFGYTNTEPRAREWIRKAATCDYHGVNKMALENPGLVRRKDVNTALHWAAKHGHLELIKLLAGTFKSDTHSKTVRVYTRIIHIPRGGSHLERCGLSNGGYTPLHLAAQFSRHEAYELLIKVYNADPNIRDHAGKKPMQYLVRQDTTVSMDTFKKIKEKRRSTESQRERDSSFLRIGSLNVRVKRTTEAFGNFLGKSNSATSIERMMGNRSWGSADNLPEAFDTSVESDKDREMMPPPNGNVVLRVPSMTSRDRDKNSRSRRSLQNSDTSSSSIKNHNNMSSSDSEESDTACGFGSEWKGS